MEVLKILKNKLNSNFSKNSENNNAKSLEVYIRSRKKDYFKGLASSITSINEKGEFDVLPLHANFITLIKDFIVIDKKTQAEQKIEIKTGVLSVSSNKVDIYLDL